MAKADDTPSVIVMDDVSKTFRLPHERHNSVKSLFLNFFRPQNFEVQKALQHASFEVKKGDFFAIVGRNGGGKSTLLKLLAGIYSPTSGDIQVHGKLTPFIELGVGFSPELTGRENVFLNGALLGFTHKEMTAMYDDIVRFAELGRFMDQKLKNYSSGMQVRLAFSIAIRAKSDILLLDEVLAVGDAAFQQKCFDYFEELKQKQQTVVFVTHDMSAVRRFCNKAIYIENGKITHQGTPAEIAEVYMVNNIEVEPEKPTKNNGPRVSQDHKISARIASKTDKEVVLKFSYKSEDIDPMYIGISILKDGISIAELITPPKLALTGSGSVTLAIDTTVFNSGVYEITQVLCRKRNRKLLNVGTNKCTFVIKGNDPIRGAAVKLADTWKQA